MKLIRRLLHKLNPFRFLKTAHKIALVTLTTLLGIGVIGVVYFSLQDTTQRVAIQIDELNRLASINERLRLSVLRGHAVLKDFFLHKDLGRLDQFQQAITDATGDAEELKKLALSDRQQEIATQFRDTINAYHDAVLDASETEILLGLDENSGLQGEMREVVHRMEELINQHDKPRLEASMLTMRRHEKDFLQRQSNKYIDRMKAEYDRYRVLLLEESLSEELSAELDELVASYQETFLLLTEAVQQRQASIRSVDERVAQLQPLEQALQKETARLDTSIREQSAAEVGRLNQFFLTALIGIGLFILLSLTLVALGIVRERAAELAKAQEENDRLNDSVATLMEATAQLSERDLTVRVPVTEDITGNIGDALNMMTTETAKVMFNINSVAGQLETAAGTVREQGQRVANVAASEREVVALALDKLQESTNTVAEITELVLNCDELAENSEMSTKRALIAVRNTMQNMNEIRNSVSETEKGIKRLGERSQEVGGILEIIKDIAGRTHTLALNAGMQAVAAGEAGRGFSVVADEVQRLAETARESTDQITRLVQSIQSEAAETMERMNKTIEQVVEGSSLAENAGKRMHLTRRSADKLIAAVSQIAERSKSQIDINEELRTQAAKLQESTVATEQELSEQNIQTENMFQHVQGLVESVRVFKLPESA